MLRTYMLSMLGIFVFLFVALNVMVHLFVTRRITHMSNWRMKSAGPVQRRGVRRQGQRRTVGAGAFVRTHAHQPGQRDEDAGRMKRKIKRNPRA